MAMVQKLFLCGLICVMFVPFLASSLGLSERSIYEVEIVALASWYITSLATPLILKDLDTVVVLWYITFVLVGVAIGSDLVYHMTQITPNLWYPTPGRVGPRFYSFVKTWALLIMPGCALFLAMIFGRRLYWKSEKTT